MFDVEWVFKITELPGKPFENNTTVIRWSARNIFIFCQQVIKKSLVIILHYFITHHTHSTTIRVINMTGGQDKISVRLNKDILADASDTPVFSVSPGSELVFCEHKLTRDQLRPNDGFSRRRVQVMGNGNVAVCEISIESVISSSGVIAQMGTSSDQKDKRILKDLSRMAAVLNNINGTQGYTR